MTPPSSLWASRVSSCKEILILLNNTQHTKRDERGYGTEVVTARSSLACSSGAATAAEGEVPGRASMLLKVTLYMAERSLSPAGAVPARLGDVFPRLIAKERCFCISISFRNCFPKLPCI